MRNGLCSKQLRGGRLLRQGWWKATLAASEGLEPQKSPKRSQEGHRNIGPGAPESKKSAPQSPKAQLGTLYGVIWTLFGLWGALFWDSGAPGPNVPTPQNRLFSDSFGVLGRRARKTPVPGRDIPNDGNSWILLVSNSAHAIATSPMPDTILV